jgi:hypothetical protein
MNARRSLKCGDIPDAAAGAGAAAPVIAQIASETAGAESTTSRTALERGAAGQGGIPSDGERRRIRLMSGGLRSVACLGPGGSRRFGL